MPLPPVLVPQEAPLPPEAKAWIETKPRGQEIPAVAKFDQALPKVVGLGRMEEISWTGTAGSKTPKQLVAGLMAQIKNQKEKMK